MIEFRIAEPVPVVGAGARGGAVKHPLSIVMTAECDLEWDYRSRVMEEGRKLIDHVLLFDVFEETDIRTEVGNSELWRQAKGNKNIRFHHLEAGGMSDGSQEQPDYYVDFKRYFTMPIASIYDGIGAGVITRACRVPDVFVHDLMQRCFAFLARVGLPDAG